MRSFASLKKTALKTQNHFWVYILECKNQHFYTGYTVDLQKRFSAHLNGTASKYTRSFKPIKILQAWKVLASKSLAMQLERQIKKLKHDDKINIITHPTKMVSHENITPIDHELLNLLNSGNRL